MGYGEVTQVLLEKLVGPRFAIRICVYTFVFSLSKQPQSKDLKPSDAGRFGAFAILPAAVTGITNSVSFVLTIWFGVSPIPVHTWLPIFCASVWKKIDSYNFYINFLPACLYKEKKTRIPLWARDLWIPTHTSCKSAGGVMTLHGKWRSAVQTMRSNSSCSSISCSVNKNCTTCSFTFLTRLESCSCPAFAGKPGWSTTSLARQWLQMMLVHA